MRFGQLTPEMELRLHLAKAREYWLADRLDLADAAMRQALRVGVPAGDHYDLQRTIEAEHSARQAAAIERLGEHLLLEGDPHRWGHYWTDIRRLAERALREVTQALRVHWGRPVLLTLIPSDEWVEFMHARYGYYATRSEWHKVCLPPVAVDRPGTLRRAALHEMAHAAVHQLAGERAPRWLDEGLAVVLEGGSYPDERRRYRLAARRGRLLTLEQVSGGFESYEMDLDGPSAALCYASAGDFVSRLVSGHGPGRVRDLLARLGHGERLDRAFRGAFGEPLARAERAWLADAAGASDGRHDARL